MLIADVPERDREAGRDAIKEETAAVAAGPRVSPRIKRR